MLRFLTEPPNTLISKDILDEYHFQAKHTKDQKVLYGQIEPLIPSS